MNSPIKSFKSSNEIWTLGDTQLLDYFIAITYEVNQDYYLRIKNPKHTRDYVTWTQILNADGIRWFI